VKIITGNDLKSGAVTWWDGKGWSLSVNEAVEVDADAAAIIAEKKPPAASTAPTPSRPTRPRKASAPPISRAHPRPGPTVRLDLSLDPSATPDRVL
jgi:hypothetical protein